MRTIPSAAPDMAVSSPPTPKALIVEATAAAPGRKNQASDAFGQIMADPVTAGVLHSAWSGDPVILVPAPPGAGKTRLVALLAAALADRAGLRVGVAAQTREQAREIACRLALLTASAGLVWSSSARQPSLPVGVKLLLRNARFPGSGGGVLVATTARWHFFDPASMACDVMVVDEAWQCTHADMGALGAFAGQIVCVGDNGQIPPVVTGSTRRWQGNASGPHQPGPDALLAAYGDAVSVVTMRHTWRLGPETTALVQPVFYAALPFTSKRPPETLRFGREVLPEVEGITVPGIMGPGDPALAMTCARRVRHLLTGRLQTSAGERAVTSEDVIVACGHVGQAAAVRAHLADLSGVLVGTANAVQGMERAVSVVLHPLAGYREASGFGLDTGRLCVMLSRHRAHVTVIVDGNTPGVLAEQPTDGAAGLNVHRAVLDRLTKVA